MRAWSSFGRCIGAMLVAAAAPIAAAAQPPASPPAPLPVGRISLADAVRLAVERNHQLRAQRLNVDLSKADEITAALKPNPNFLSTNELFPVFSPSQLTWDNFVNNQNFVQSVTYLFERGGKREKRTQVARDTTDVAAKTAADAERQLTFQTAQAFIGVLLANSTLDLARENLKNFTDVVDVNRERMRAGDLAEADFFKISLQKLQFEQDLSSAEIGVVQAKAALRLNVGFENLTDDFEVDGSLAYRKYPITLDDLKRDALAARPDLLAAQTGIALAQHAQALALANKPRDITGDLEYDRPGRLAERHRVHRVRRPAVPRSEPGQHRAQQGGHRAGDGAGSVRPRHRREPTSSRRTRRCRPTRRSCRSFSPAIWTRRSNRSTSRPTSTGRATGRCSTCWMPSAPIGRRSWRTARRWRRT